MKKLFLLLLAALACNVNANAQFQAGLKIQPSLNWFTVEADEPSSTSVEKGAMSVGFSYGAMLDYFFQDNAGFAFEVRYNSIRGSFSHTYPGDTGSVMANHDLKMQFVEIPVTLKMRTNEIGYMKYFGQFGFTPAINVRTRADRTMNGVTEEGIKIRDNIRPFNLYLVLGGGLEYNLGGSTSIVASITYNNGFIDQWADKADNRDLLVKHQFVALGLGVLF